MKTSRFIVSGISFLRKVGGDHSQLAALRLTIYELHMAKSATIFAASQQQLTLAALVLPQASILEVASVLDPLRSANRHLGHESYRWRVVSPDGRAVPLTCGIELPSSGPLSAADGADALVVIAGFRQWEGATPPLIHELSRLAPRFDAVGGIDAGAWVLARAGLLNGHRATVHWEDMEDFAATHPQVEVLPDRFVISGPRFTAGGAAPAADLMLHLISSRHGPALSLAVAASFITSARPGAEPQRATPSLPARQARLDPRVVQAIARMERRIDAPESVAETAAAVGLSTRRLEVLFHQGLGMTPGAYGLHLRLQAARRMITDTRHPLAEVALRTGFSAPSALSRAIRRAYGRPPGAFRPE